MKTTTEKTLILAALALGLALPASAQTAQPAASDPAPASASSGLVGNSYTEFSLGYDKQSTTPGLLHDYNLLYNESVSRSDVFGVDGSFSYDYLSGGAVGRHDYRNEILFGATGYATESWGKPFVTAQAGWATQQTADLTSNSLAYALTAGVEVPVYRSLFLTPFLTYEAEPHLRDHSPATAELPNYAMSYGVKATYRIDREWSASLGAQMQDRSSRDLGLRAGLSYHF